MKNKSNISVLDNDNLDYKNEIIRSFKNKSPDFKTIEKLAILLGSTKNFDFQKEYELRFLCDDIYNYKQGYIIASGKKNLLEYKGLLSIN